MRFQKRVWAGISVAKYFVGYFSIYDNENLHKSTKLAKLG